MAVAGLAGNHLDRGSTNAREPPTLHPAPSGENTVTRGTAALTELVTGRALLFTVAGSVVVITAVGAVVWLLLTA